MKDRRHWLRAVRHGLRGECYLLPAEWLVALIGLCALVGILIAVSVTLG